MQTIDSEINALLHFTLNPNNTVITNSTFLDDSNKAEIVSENYRLLGVNIDQSLLESDLDNIISDMQKLKIFYKLKEYGISTKELENVKQIKAIIQKNEKEF